MLDTRSMGFSAVNLPPGTSETQVQWIRALGSHFCLREPKRTATAKWIGPVEVALIFTCSWALPGILTPTRASRRPIFIPLVQKEDSDVYSLNVKTLQLEWLLSSKYDNFDADLFAGFQPSLSPPTL
ncbi:hypothetical protein ZWY2020_009659 [Hordeum vulgare]|nr:hypothetical protein ZWY2020_009659 [Hordeum vulgare]